ncbi:SDR family NAD(P)-dependent oxidoreductase [Alkalibacterium pelagium]|jgi:short-subunit dehydrogenase|uniref:Short-chain dehydrogenase n=1 Tax=Alkalibacterium pelagium TaxID=426702 RepID=A0A1H7M3R5_9LACT|nr:SDR family NAD(P)-dependent oxidoreductase [Alkalibacterium pelagium]GEN51046.1 short-chain dehydrogenase [Alkalibacterium pelagium]SEL05834.1 Short-chain dehydrogenase [Alkalibacterium pelagium]
MKVNGKTIVVTGGGSGMGRELVLELAKRGARVAAVDINKEAVLETARLAPESKEKISTHVVNITEREAIEKLVDEVKEFHGTVDGIINNAGIIQPFIDVNDLGYDKIEQVMNVNFYGTLYMVKSFLPELLKRPEAHILNVASMGGFLPVPGQSIYGASKAAVKLMTEGLHSELTDTNVGVTIAFPGAIKTNIMQNSKVERKATTDTSGKEYKLTLADDAAKIMIDAIESNAYRVMVGNDAKMMDRMYRVMPKKAAAIIAEKLKN